MSYKIAVSSTDAINVNQHFGKTEKFLIYEVKESGEFELLEQRRLQQEKDAGGHSEERLLKLIGLVEDCQYVLVSQIGPGVDRRLNLKGITSFGIDTDIETAIHKITKFRKYQESVKKRKEVFNGKYS